MSQANTVNPGSRLDEVVVLAAVAWGSAATPDFWSVFSVERGAVLRERAGSPLGTLERSAALERLRSEHLSQMRPDPTRIHPSWHGRALEEEPTSVRAVVLSCLPGGLDATVREALGPSLDLDCPIRAGDLGAVRVALALWDERLVGDVATREDDPPVIVMLTQFDRKVIIQCFRELGTAKRALARGELGDWDPAFREVATRDVADAPKGEPHVDSRLGLTSVARMLGIVDSHRARWAMQHLPYGSARRIREIMGTAGARRSRLANWERALLRVVWDDLHRDGWIDVPWRWEG